MIKKRLYLAMLGFAAISGTESALAQCTTCTDVSKYGAGVVESVADAAASNIETAESITSKSADTSQALYDTSEEVVSAIMAGSGEVSAEIIRSSETNTRIMEVMAAQLEQLYKTRMVADANMKAAETHGAGNIPSGICQPFSRIRDVGLVRNLLREHRDRQLKERNDDLRTRVSDLTISSMTSLTSNIYMEGDAELAMAQVSLLTGENAFSFSPDTINALAERGLTNASPESIQTMSGWLRTSGAGIDVAQQIAKRTRPAADPKATNKDNPVGVFEEFWLDAEKAMSKGALIEDAQSSEVKLLRTLVRRQALSNRIRLEQLEAALAKSRMASSQIGYLSEEALRAADPAISKSVIDSAVRKGTTSE